MKSIVVRMLFGGLAAASLAIAGCGSSVPAHPGCQQDSDCPSGDACHFPYGAANGVCVVTCTQTSGCPSAEPLCIPEGGASSPFDFCACSNPGPDGGVSPACGEVPGYTCELEVQVCRPG